MVDKNLLNLLYSMSKEAVEYCNHVEKKEKQAPFSLDKLDENFAQDLVMLASYPICADRKISLKEIESLNCALEEYGIEIKSEDFYELYSLVRSNPFEVPKTLRLLVLEAWYTSREDYGFMPPSFLVAQKAIAKSKLENIILMYARFMCSMVEDGKLLPEEEQVMEECLETCCKFVSQQLQITFNIKEGYRHIIKMWHAFEY